jgi:hypothetical protein
MTSKLTFLPALVKAISNLNIFLFFRHWCCTVPYLVKGGKSLENTEELQRWINHQVESRFDGNLTAFAEKTQVSRQTWMNILSRKYASLRQQAVSDLCGLFELTELDLYLIAHPDTIPYGVVKESSETYRTKDDAERLVDHLRKSSEKDREFIYAAAERCGFRRYNK